MSEAAAFHASFVCMGLITAASALIFAQLNREEAARKAAEAPLEMMD